MYLFIFLKFNLMIVNPFSRVLSVMYGTHTLCNANSDTYVPAWGWHLLRHNVSRCFADGYHDGSGVSPASDMVSPVH